LGRDFAEPDAAGSSLFRTGLKPDQRSESRFPQRIGQTQPNSSGENESNHREPDAEEKEDGIPARV